MKQTDKLTEVRVVVFAEETKKSSKNENREVAGKVGFERREPENTRVGRKKVHFIS